MQRLKNAFLVGSVLVFTVMISATAANGQFGTRSRVDQKRQIVVVCHATGSKDNPYETTEVRDNGVAHRSHPADIVPAPVDGCPGPGGVEPVEPVPEPLTMLLFGAGVAGAGYAARRIKRQER